MDKDRRIEAQDTFQKIKSKPFSHNYKFFHSPKMRLLRGSKVFKGKYPSNDTRAFNLRIGVVGLFLTYKLIRIFCPIFINF